MKIRLTFSLDLAARISISENVGDTGPASRADCIYFINRAVAGELETIGFRSEDFDASEADGLYRPGDAP